MVDDPLGAALAEMARRAERSDRDLGPLQRHVEQTLPEICRRWNLRPRHVFGSGAGSPVLAVDSPSGPGVLKVDLPGSLDRPVATMRGAPEGYAIVLDWDRAAGALLTERLGTDLWSEQDTLLGQIEVIAPLLSAVWQQPPGPGEQKAAGLAQILRDLGPRYGSQAPTALALAAEHAAALAVDEQAEVVCHGDPHPQNVLRRGTGWAFIDPDGFVGERAYDLAVVLRDGVHELMSADDPVAVLSAACAHAGALTGIDAGRIWRWAFVERVTTGLHLAWFGHLDEAAGYLGTAERLAQTSSSPFSTTG